MGSPEQVEHLCFEPLPLGRQSAEFVLQTFDLLLGTITGQPTRGGDELGLCTGQPDPSQPSCEVVLRFPEERSRRPHPGLRDPEHQQALPAGRTLLVGQDVHRPQEIQDPVDLRQSELRGQLVHAPGLARKAKARQLHARNRNAAHQAQHGRDVKDRCAAALIQPVEGLQWRAVARKLSRSGRLLMAAIAIAAALAVLEIGLRVADPFHAGEAIDREVFARAVLVRDSAGFLRLRKGTTAHLLGHEVTISEQGFRNAPVVTPKPADTFRILVIGDSVAFGWGVAEADAFPRVIERSLRATGFPGDGRTVEVVNAGVPGWGAPNELLFLREEGLALSPDLVLVTLVNNDLTDVLQAIAPSDDPPPLVFPDWARTTYLGRFVEQVTAAWTGRTARPDFFLTLDLAPDPVQRASDALVQAFGAMKTLCGGTPFAIIDTVGTAEGWRLEPFASGAEAAGITRIEAFLPADGYRARYSVAATDDHPNATGHTEIAQPVVDWIRNSFR